MDTPIKPVDAIPLSHAPEEIPGPLAVAFRTALANLALALRRWLLPHFGIGLGLFLLAAYVSSFVLFSSWVSPGKWLGMALVFLLYAAAAFCYAFFTTCLLALRLACIHWGEFLEAVLDHIQTYAAEKAAGLHTGLTKPQAKTILRASIRQTVAQFHPAQTGLARALGLFTAAVTVIAVRAVLFSKIGKWSGKTLQLGKLFAGKATLAGAIFLNLRFFSTLLLGLCYALGVAAFVLNIYFVLLLQYIVK